MSQALHDNPPVTIAEFDAFLLAQPDARAWELVDGQIVGMTNPSTTHEQIVSNVGVRLKLSADDRGCQTFFGGMRIQRSDDAGAVDKPRPDILVRCGPMPGGTYVTDPIIVVEVLSPSTMDVDRGEKLRFYKRVPTMHHIVLIYQDQMRAEHYRRADIGWNSSVFTKPEDRLRFEALGIGLLLADAYFGTVLETRTP
ncbi:MAG: Uma2 family endonuclease [Gemmatimonadaceae bacterium]|nr:Uma2 family endonuclease [Acetobacteraceae bacterium]